MATDATFMFLVVILNNNKKNNTLYCDFKHFPLFLRSETRSVIFILLISLTVNKISIYSKFTVS